MNKKPMMFTLTLVTVAMLTTPIVGMVQAGKGQNKLDFKLLIQGLPSGGEQKTADGNTIWKDRIYTLLGGFYVQIGAGGAVEDISKDYLEYEGTMDYQNHVKMGFMTVHVRETIYIYDDDRVHDETTLRGTLVNNVIGDNKAGNGANFVGFGTGEFEGVKVEGTSAPLAIVGGNPDPPGYYIELVRTGTVMGWPT